MRQTQETSDEVRVGSARLPLGGTLTIPPGAVGMVLFAHGSGSSRFSPRNQLVAARLRATGLATLLMDLLTEEEEDKDAATAEWRFNIPLLTERVLLALAWSQRDSRTRRLNAGIFGASTGAAAALAAAAERPDLVDAVVSRGGRPDLAEEFLPRVLSPTLLIVGGADRTVVELNSLALRKLNGQSRLVIVPDATHLFEEPGALEQVADHAAEWFGRHLSAAGVW